MNTSFSMRRARAALVVALSTLAAVACSTRPTSPYPNNPACPMLERGEQQTPPMYGAGACALNAAEGSRCSYAGEPIERGAGLCRDVGMLGIPGLAEYARTNRVPKLCVYSGPVGCLFSDGSYRCGDGVLCFGATDDAGTNGTCVPLPCN